MAIKNFICFSLLLSVLTFTCGCGGGNMTFKLPAIQPNNPYFNSSMIGQHWTFQNGYGDSMIISIEAGPVTINGISVAGPVMHFTKNAGRSYWQPGTEQAELWFPLSNSPIGWASAGSKMNFPLGCWFCAGFTHAEQIVTPSSGAYLIAPSGPVAVNTSYSSHWTRNDGISFDTIVSWRTDAIAGTVSTPIYTGPALIVKVREGCETGDNTLTGCYFEEYDYAPNLGWVAVIPYNQGRGPVDPLIAMQRIN